jgi:hypothetical protein
VRLSPSRPILLVPGDKRMNIISGGMIIYKEKSKYLGKSVPVNTLSITNPAWIALESKQSLRGDSCCSGWYGSAYCYPGERCKLYLRDHRTTYTITDHLVHNDLWRTLCAMLIFTEATRRQLLLIRVLPLLLPIDGRTRRSLVDTMCWIQA